MKTFSALLTRAALVLIVSLLIGCLPMSDAERDKLCKENQLTTSASELIYYTMTLKDHDHYPDEGHILFNSIAIDLAADVYLIDCYGDEADHKSYQHSFAPTVLIPPASTTFELMAIPGLRFTFHNSREYLKIKYTIKAYFGDGAVYLSDTMTSNSYRYSTLNEYSKPIVIKLYQDGLAWNKLP